MDNKFLIQTDYGPMRFRHDLIQKRMEELGLTPAQAGVLCGCSGNLIKRAAGGENITFDTFLRIARGLNLIPEFLLKEKVSFRRAVESAAVR